MHKNDAKIYIKADINYNLKLIIYKNESLCYGMKHKETLFIAKINVSYG